MKRTHEFIDPKISDLMTSIEDLATQRSVLLGKICEDINLIEDNLQKLKLGIELEVLIPYKDSEVYYFRTKKDEHKNYRIYLVNATAESEKSFREVKIEPRLKFYPFLYLLLQELNDYIIKETNLINNLISNISVGEK